MTDIVKDCELYANVIEGIIVVENDWQPGDPERREPRETLLKAAAEIELLREALRLCKQDLLATFREIERELAFSERGRPPVPALRSTESKTP